MKSKKVISRKNFGTKIHFCHFKNGQKSIFELGEKFKTAKNVISREKKDLFDFTSFFAPEFYNFLAHCAYLPVYRYKKTAEKALDKSRSPK